MLFGAARQSAVVDGPFDSIIARTDQSSLPSRPARPSTSPEPILESIFPRRRQVSEITNWVQIKYDR